MKDSVRDSKARRAQQVSAALAAAGFCAPLAVAAGEKRKQRLLVGSFLLTEPVVGVSLLEFLRACHDNRTRSAVSEKHAGVRQLAREIRRFHDLGFVHGDLLATNIFISYGEGQPLKFCFMDNDRTHRYPRSLPQLLWKRNLVQLNRMPLPGISLQDRMRFLDAYLGEKFNSQRAVSLARWLEKKTRERRLACDAVESAGSFRRLMRWQA